MKLDILVLKNRIKRRNVLNGYSHEIFYFSFICQISAETFEFEIDFYMYEYMYKWQGFEV